MNLKEAYKACLEGNFVSNENFGSDQSMHSYRYNMYYEDGANINFDSRCYLEQQSWAQEGWCIKFTRDRVDLNKLYKMHESSKGLMLQTGSYENCILPVTHTL